MRAWESDREMGGGGRESEREGESEAIMLLCA